MASQAGWKSPPPAEVGIEHPQTAMRKDDFRLVHSWDTKESLFYNLSRELGETNNLPRSKPEVVALMLAELKTPVRTGVGKAEFGLLESSLFASRKSVEGR